MVSSQCAIITARKRSLGQGKIFAPVCHSVHRWGRPGQVSPWAGTPPPPWQVPPGRYTPMGRYIPWAGTPPWAGTLPGQVHPPWAGTPPLGRYSPCIAGIRSTSGRYASYWNAFLLVTNSIYACSQ